MLRHAGPVAAVAGAVLLGWAVIAANAWSRAAAIDKLTAAVLPGSAFPAEDRESPTGYAGGRRALVMPSGYDACHWIMMAQRMAAGEGWRIRRTDADNAPEGREIHWSMSVAWLLWAGGSAASFFSGRPVGAEIERAALWVMPVVHGLLLAGFAVWITRLFGWRAGAAAALALGCSYAPLAYFAGGAPDHHGLAAAALLACVAALGGALRGREAAGGPGGGKASLPVIGGVCAGAALWVSASTALPALGSLFAALLAAAVLPGVRGGVDPRVPVRFGASAGVASLLFWALEYAPVFQSGWRLEVNNPVYAAALFGAGLAVSGCGRWALGEGFGRNFARLAAGLALLCAPAVFFAATGWRFAPSDPLLWRLHRDWIHEFAPFWKWAAGQSPEALAIGVSPLPLLLAPAVLRLLRRASAPGERAALLAALGPALALLCLGLAQVRWMNTAAWLWVAPLALLASAGRGGENAPRRKVWGLAAGAGFGLLLLALCGPLVRRVAIETVTTLRKGPVITAGDYQALYARHLAWRLRALAGGRGAVVLSGPTTSTLVAYYGGLRGLGTLYWENLEGLRAAAEIYAATDWAEAARRLAARDAGFWLLTGFEPFADGYAAVRGVRPEETVAGRLLAGEPPPVWLREIPLPSVAEAAGLDALLFDTRRAGLAAGEGGGR